MIRAVLFDLDRTLLDRDTSFHNFLLSQYERFSSSFPHVDRDAYISRIVFLDNRGRMGKDKVYQFIVEEFKIQEVSPQYLHYDFEFRISDYYLPFPGLKQCLRELTAAGYLLGIISNGRHAFQMRTLHALEIERDFEAILISESEGVRKPEPEIFHRALRKLGCSPNQAVFVGDHPEVDLEGARAVGMKTIWKRNDDFSGPVEADAVLDRLEELPALIAKMGVSSSLDITPKV
jgi:putative hydrolase of the HAD superfamily